MGISGKKMATSTTNEDTAKKLLKDVVPGLGIRVHSVNPTRSGSALVLTLSVAERQKLATSVKIQIGAENNCAACAQVYGK